MIYKLALPGEKIEVANLPLSQWTVVTPSTVQISGNSIINTGSGGWVETAYVSFTVPSTGSYTVSYDYDFANGYVGNWASYGFGLFISPNSAPPQDSWTYYENSANRVGYVIANPSTSIEGWKGTVTFTTTLNAGTTYYLWFPGGALNDGVTYTLTFKNIAIYNDPIQYTASRDIKFNGTRVTYDYTPPPAWGELYNVATEVTAGSTYKGNTIFGTIDNFSGKYGVVKFDWYDSVGGGAQDVNIKFNTTERRWRCHWRWSGNMPIANGSAGYVNDSSLSTSYNSQDGGCYYTSSFATGTYTNYKLIVELSTGKTSIYLGHDGNLTYAGYMTTESNIQYVRDFKIGKETSQGTQKVKNVKVAWFDSLADALAY